MFNGFWSEFSILLIAAVLGSIAILPYSVRLIKESEKKKPLKLPLGMLLVLSVFQNAVLFAIVIGIGLIIAHKIGLSVPLVGAIATGSDIIQPVSTLVIPLILGLFGGGAMLLMDLRFLPHLPKKLVDTAKKTTQWENFTASFYGGINEELIMRLFGLSLIAWLLAMIWHTSAGMPTTAVFLFANIFMSIVFALGHLPALKNLVGKITSLLLLRTLVLNGVIGIICGWSFLNYGIEAAILVHFTADIVYHIGGTAVLKRVI